MEKTNSVNLTFRKAGGPLEFEVGLFYHDISDYVFARLIQSEIETGVRANMLAYNAADVEFSGIDGQVSYQFDPPSRLIRKQMFRDPLSVNLTARARRRSESASPTFVASGQRRREPPLMTLDRHQEEEEHED